MHNPYGTSTVAIKNHIKTVVASANSFVNSTFFDRIASQDERTKNPIVLITFEEDIFGDRGPHTTVHTLTFHAEVMYLCEYTESTLDTMIGYVGQIIDKIEADRGFSEDAIEMIEILDIDYTWEENESMVIRKALIRIEVLAYRNI